MNKRFVLLLVGLSLTTSAPLALAQEAPQSQLRRVVQIHVRPGSAAEFEALHKARNARMAEVEVTFPTRLAVTEGPIYREVTAGLENMAALDRLRTQLMAMGSPDAAIVARVREAIEYRDHSIWRTRPDLSYVPDNPRVPIADAGFIREVRFYLQQSTGQEAEEVLGKLTALAGSRNIQDVALVSTQAYGSDMPLLHVHFLARDVSDFYAQRDKNLAALGAEYSALVAELRALCRRVEQVDWTIRRDLAYEPAD